jgi:RNA polymerase sigma-70 factor, ECF subfamily
VTRPEPAPLPSSKRPPAETAPDPLDDVVDAVRCGDPDAIAAVYLAVAPGLRGFLRRRVGHGEVADDLVEHTFVELLEGCEGIRGDGRSLRAWLYRAARHNLYDWRKRAERRSDHELRRQHSDLLADQPQADPALRADAEALDPALELALRELTVDQRDILELRLVAGLPIAEVARITGRSGGAVKQVQRRALRRLAGLLTDQSADPARPARVTDVDP